MLNWGIKTTNVYAVLYILLLLLLSLPPAICMSSATCRQAISVVRRTPRINYNIIHLTTKRISFYLKTQVEPRS